MMNEETRREKLLSRFREFHGREPKIDNPTRFSDKVFARIFGPPDPIYPIIGYKHLAPKFVRAVAGGDILIPHRYLVTRELMAEHFETLPQSFVLKSSYSSGLNQIIKDKSSIDVDSICEKFNSRLSTIRNARFETGEWNCVIVEEYLDGGDTLTPDDIKLHCFNRTDGRFEYILSVNSGRHQNPRQSFFDETGAWLPFVYKGKIRHEQMPNIPSNILEMIEIAKKLSDGFDHLRVDLYSINGAVYFGELTPFTLGARIQFDQPEADEWMGAKWDQRTPMYAGY